MPYAAGRAAGRIGAEVLHEELTEITISERGPDDFNISIAIFPSKGVADDDTETSVKRAPGDTRPLNLKNCDCHLDVCASSRPSTPTTLVSS